MLFGYKQGTCVTCVYANPAGESNPSNSVTKGLANAIKKSTNKDHYGFTVNMSRGNISFPSNSNVREVRLYNTNGRIVFQRKLEGKHSFSIRDCPDGFYVLHVMIDKGVLTRGIVLNK